MQTVEITITEEGAIRFLVNETTAPLVSADAVTRRASHVEPDGYIARAVFHSLRRLFGEKGAVSEFTRRWPVLWRVNLAPIGGPVMPGRWRDRSAAIAFEIEHLNAHFI